MANPQIRAVTSTHKPVESVHNCNCNANSVVDGDDNNKIDIWKRNQLIGSWSWLGFCLDFGQAVVLCGWNGGSGGAYDAFQSSGRDVLLLAPNTKPIIKSMVLCFCACLPAWCGFFIIFVYDGDSSFARGKFVSIGFSKASLFVRGRVWSGGVNWIHSGRRAIIGSEVAKKCVKFLAPLVVLIESIRKGVEILLASRRWI